MVTVPEVVEGFAALKTGFDMFRSAVGLVKEVQGILPPEKAEAVSAAIDASELQVAVAEAAIARGLGFTLHQCQFPPPIMLDVGYRRTGERVLECPKCHGTSAGPFNFIRERTLPAGPD